jgi:DNA-binding Lrp family transcriptional regulator
MDENNGPRGRRARKKHESLHGFYLVKPRHNANADELADKLIQLNSVEEVLLTEGDYGFLIKASFFDGEEPKNVTDYIAKNISSKFGKVVSYYQYSK